MLEKMLEYCYVSQGWPEIIVVKIKDVTWYYFYGYFCQNG